MLTDDLPDDSSFYDGPAPAEAKKPTVLQKIASWSKQADEYEKKLADPNITEGQRSRYERIVKLIDGEISAVTPNPRGRNYAIGSR